MKEPIQVAAIFLLGIFSFASCSTTAPSSEYYCICNFVRGSVDTRNDTEFVTPSEAKATAKTACDDEVTTLTSSGDTLVGCGLYKK